MSLEENPLDGKRKPKKMTDLGHPGMKSNPNYINYLRKLREETDAAENGPETPPLQ